MSTMTPGYKSTFARTLHAEGLAEGLVEGEARAVLRVLASRGLELSGDSAERIRACRDQDQLDVWLDRALSVNSAEEIFD